MNLKLVIAFILVACGCSFAEQNVTLTKPYPPSYRGAPTDKISVQYAVIEIAKQAGYNYDWNTSYRNTNPQCRMWIRIEFKDIPFEEGMKRILDPFSLTYEIRDNTIFLKRNRVADR